MWVWFYKPETRQIGFTTLDDDCAAACAFEDWAEPVSPALWFGMILEAMRSLGYGLPGIPEPPAAAALVFWRENGEVAYFPLAFADTNSNTTVRLGFLLHQIAQVMIDDPEAWRTVKVMGDGEEEGDFGEDFEGG